jgi:hypothetical protein
MKPVRTSVAQLVALGQFPPEQGATGAQVQEFEVALLQIGAPLTKEEAVALLPVFGQTIASALHGRYFT